MKIGLYILLITCSYIANAQVTLVHTHSNAGLNAYPDSWEKMLVVNLEVHGDKFVIVNNKHKKIKFYNLNHTLWRTISYSDALDLNLNNNSANILYISQHLFDLDDEIEFLYVDLSTAANTEYVTQVINEDGTILFTATDQAPIYRVSVPQAEVPIYNTSNGTFMILSGTSDGDAYIYSLAGSLVAGIAPSPIQEMQSFGTSLAYPNPAMYTTRIDYMLPQGVHEGWLVFYNTEGQEVQRFHVDETFNSIEVTTQDLSSGTYYYNLQTAQGASGGKKLVTIR